MLGIAISVTAVFTLAIATSELEKIGISQIREELAMMFACCNPGFGGLLLFRVFRRLNKPPGHFEETGAITLPSLLQ